jgi:predicted kinase
MTTPSAIVVTGMPCSGKTSLARHLNKSLAIPWASKDMFKELLFDTLGCRDRAWSKRLDVPSVALLFNFLKTHLEIGHCCLIDHWFDAHADVQHLKELQKELRFTVIQILCHAPGPSLFSRFKERAVSGNRHPGHCDEFTYDEHRSLLVDGHMEPLDTGGPLIKVDTSQFERVSFEEISTEVAKLLHLVQE